MQILGNAGWYREDKTTEGVTSEAYSLSTVADGLLPGLPRASSAVQVTATYDIDNYTRDVTSLAHTSGYNPNTVKTQIITTTYVENDIKNSTTFNVTVNKETLPNSIKTDTSKIDNVRTNDSTTIIAFFALVSVTLSNFIVILKKRLVV